MENINIPLFRAKKLNSNEYVIGSYNQYIQNGKVYHCITIVGSYPSPFDNTFLIDIETLSISFNDMLDSQGNKIFASLSEDGKGGDIIKYEMYSMHMKYKKIEPSIKTSICIFTSKGFNMMVSLLSNDYYGIKIIGIRK